MKKVALGSRQLLIPHQLGVACTGGAEIAAHTYRIYGKHNHLSIKVLIKIDSKQTF